MPKQCLTFKVFGQFFIEQTVLQRFNEIVIILSHSQVLSFPANGFNNIVRKIISWHFGPLLVSDFKVTPSHGFLQTIQSFAVNFKQLFQLKMISVQNEQSSS